MSDLRRLLQPGLGGFDPPDDVDDVATRVNRRQRARRLLAGALAAVVTLGGVAFAARQFDRSTHRPAVTPTPSDEAVGPGPSPTDEASPSVFRPYATHFFDDLRGIVVGSTGPQGWFSSCHPECVAEVRETGDGGETWTTIYRGEGEGELSDLAAFGDSDLWATAFRCADESSDCRTDLLHSADAGRSWEELGAAPGLRSLSFVSASEGWGIRGEGVGLVRTGDGGRTWRPALIPCPEDDDALRSVFFAEAARGWVLCGHVTGGEREDKTLLETRDGGATWAVIARSPTADRASVGSGLEDRAYAGINMWFHSDGRGIIAMGESGPSIRTVNGGRDWGALDLREDHFTWLSSISFAGSSTYATVSRRSAPHPDDGLGLGVTLLRSDDDGVTWQEVYLWPIGP